MKEPVINYSEFATIDGIDFEIRGETFDEPMYPTAEIKAHNRIMLIWTKNKFKVAEVHFEHPFTKEDLIKAVKDVKEKPTLMLSKEAVEIIKRSPDYESK